MAVAETMARTAAATTSSAIQPWPARSPLPANRVYHRHLGTCAASRAPDVEALPRRFGPEGGEDYGSTSGGDERLGVRRKPSVTEVPRALDAAYGPRSSPVSSAVRLGQGLGGGLLGGLADVVVDGLADDAGGEVVEMGVELLGECEVFGPEGCVVELLGGA